MTKRTLYLFPDTNLFIQCRPLADLDWSEWDEFEEVHLIACRPVQREIDSQKNRENDRVARRARTTYGVFMRIIDSESGFELVRPVGPQVKLYLQGPSLPSEELKGTLDYGKADDEIVGYLYKYKQENPNEDARLLTHDGGPMMTAKSLGIPFIPIKDEWLLTPEHNESEKEVARLKERIRQLEKAEPRFKIDLVDPRGEILDEIRMEFLINEPMSPDEIRTLMQMVKSRFPLVEDFGSREPAERDNPSLSARFLGAKEVYTPASDDAITKYTSQDYPKWVKRCQKSLSDLHEALQHEVGTPAFTFAIVNDGTRPGNNALVQVSVEGNSEICPPPYVPEREEKETHQALALPNPPRAPKGRWNLRSPRIDLALGRMSRLGGPISPMGFPKQQSILEQFNPSLLMPARAMNANNRRDPNGFYYKPNRPSKPGKSFSLECEQWRHSTGLEYFRGEIFFDHSAEEIQGVLLCQVHAENLSEPVVKKIPVRITVRKTDSNGRARELVRNLIEPTI